MKDREQFRIIDSSLGKKENFVELEIGERLSVPFTGGEIIFATDSLGERVVIKKPRDDDQAKHEWDGLRRVESTGISIPRPIALISYSADQLAILSSFIEGDNLYYNPNPSIKSEVGRQVKSLHQNAQVEGGTWESTGRSTFVYYDRYIFHWTHGGLKELQADSRTASVLGKLIGTASDFCQNSKPVFNHNDLHDGQIIVDGNNHPTIIDFGNWMEETWLNEIGYHLFHLIRTDRAETDDFSNFLDGYFKDRKMSDTEKSNLAFYLLFISSRALNYFYNRHSSYLSTAQETHEKVLGHVDNERIWKDI